MPTSPHRDPALLERVIFNPIAILFIMGVIVVAVNLFLMCTRPETSSKPVQSLDRDKTVNEEIVKDYR